MEIREAIVRELQARLPARPFSIVHERGWELRVFAPNAEVGFVAISEDGEEATVCVGKLTHGHFNPYDQSLTADQRARWVSSAVVDFLELLFLDRVLIWSAGASGGWRILEHQESPPPPAPGVRAHLWSGPC